MNTVSKITHIHNEALCGFHEHFSKLRYQNINMSVHNA